MIIKLSIRRQDFINSVGRTTAVLAGSYIGNDLRDLSCRGLDRLGTLYFCIPNLEAIFQHAVKVNQTAVRHRCIRAVVQIMVVDITLLVGIGHMRRQHLKPNGLTDNTSRQIPLGIENITVLIGILVDYRAVFVEELVDGKVDISRF